MRIRSVHAKSPRRKDPREGQRADDEAELRRAESSLKSFTKWPRDLDALQQALGEDDPELPMRCAAHLRQFLERIEVFAVGHPAPYDADTRDGEDLLEYVDAIFDEHDLPRPAGFDAFLQHIA